MNEGGDGMSAVLDMQAGHTSIIAGAHYARATEDHRQVSRELMHQYYLVSRQWEALLLQKNTTEAEDK